MRWNWFGGSINRPRQSPFALCFHSLEVELGGGKKWCKQWEMRSKVSNGTCVSSSLHVFMERTQTHTHTQRLTLRGLRGVLGKTRCLSHNQTADDDDDDEWAQSSVAGKRTTCKDACWGGAWSPGEGNPQFTHDTHDGGNGC